MKDEEVELNFQKRFGKKFYFFPFKMFSIREDDKDEKEIFYSIQQASEKTGIPSEEIAKALQRENTNRGKGRYFSRTDKKLFWIYDEEQGMPFIQIGKDDFPDVNSVMKRFGLSREDVIYQLCKDGFSRDFYDSQEGYHQISWKSPSLRILIDALKQAQMVEKVLNKFPPKGAIQENARSLVEEIEKLF